jgi:hypothetical protein
MPRTSEWSLPFRFSTQTIVCMFYFSHAYYMLCQTHSPWFDWPNNIYTLFTIWPLKIYQWQSLCIKCVKVPFWTMPLYWTSHKACEHTTSETGEQGCAGVLFPWFITSLSVGEGQEL